MNMFVSQVRQILILVLLLFFFDRCAAEDAIVQGGSSPDGRYEVRVYQMDSGELSEYYYAVVDSKTQRVIQRLEQGGGLLGYKGAKETSQVIWHSSGDFFALTDHGARHSMEMYVYAIAPPKVTLLTTQDYFQNALGRVGATSVYATSVVKPLRWDKDDLICDLFFDAYTETGSRSPQYSTEFTVNLEHGQNMAPNLRFVSMKPPVEQGG